MNTETPSFLTDDDLARELATARLSVDELLHAIRDFTVIAHEQPWLFLDDLLADLRASSITVAVLEQLQGRR